MYKYRGLLTALLGVLLLCLPAASVEFVVMVVAVVVFAAAFVLRVWARVHIGEHTRGEELSCPGLVQTGPYRYMRHPLYLANFMAGASFALLHMGVSWAALGFCAVYGIFLLVLARQENMFLETNRGQIRGMHPGQLWGLAEEGQSRGIAPTMGAFWADKWTWVWQILMLGAVFFLKP